MLQTVLDEYLRRKQQADLKYARLHRGARAVQLAASAAGLLAFAFLIQAIRGQNSFWWSAAALAIAGALLVLLRAHFDTNPAWRRSVYYENSIARTAGEKPNSGFTGDIFARDGHLYQYDLNVLGKDSLFDRLAWTRTILGQRGLAHVLLEPASADQARMRQAAVRELADKLDVRERIALIGRFRFQDVPADGFERWLDMERGGFPAWLPRVLIIVTLTWIAIGAIGLALHLDKNLLAVIVGATLAAQGLFCQRVRERTLEEVEMARSLATQTSLLRQGLRVLRENPLSARRLIELQQAADAEDRALARLERLLMIVEHRTKEWFYPLTVALALGTHTAIALQHWKSTYAAPLHRWLQAWSEFEALAALATFAAEHDEYAWPEIIDPEPPGNAFFVAQAIRHPLLRAEIAVTNDVALGNDLKYLLISGSNMAGKSTLLRALGSNAVLALAGAPVAAQSLRMNVVRLAASIGVNDSLSDGKSKFLAEVERLKEIVTIARENRGAAMFLIDELLAGTNSADRKTVAESVVQALSDTGAVGAISTHDLALAEIAAASGRGGENVHMASRSADDPLAFDYRLQRGINRITNGIAIVRMMGLESPVTPDAGRN